MTGLWTLNALIIDITIGVGGWGWGVSVPNREF
jgi:hypothetical protein